jgi:tetratricopeptide (TPR) repeat protein
MFNRQQLIFIGSAVFLVLVMYFGCDRIPNNHKNSQKETVSARGKDADIQQLIQSAKTKLSSDQASNITSLEQQVQVANSDTAKSTLFKRLSGAWYRTEQKTLAGYFANQVAAIDKTEQSWNIAGSTLFEGIRESENEELKKYCTENAAKAFENALALNPKSIEYQISLALCYTENPPQDNPMKGILMLRDLDTKNPSNPQILFQLAKLAMRTNQYDRAIQRLEQILKISPKSPEAVCLLSDAYAGAGNKEKSAAFAKQCEGLLKK